MKFGTLCSKRALLGRDLRRFAPAWVLYGIFLCLEVWMFVYTLIPSIRQPRELWEYLEGILRFSGTMTQWWGLVLALLLFGDLCNRRLCYGLHAMPMRRDGWFAVHLTAGVLMLAIPTAVAGVLAMPALGKHWAAAFLWLLGMVLIGLYYFSIGAFSAMCTGSRIGMVIVYIGLVFLPRLVSWLVSAVCLPTMPGVVLNSELLELSIPSAYCRGIHPLSFLAGKSFGDTGWWYYIAMTGVAVVVLALSWVLYRRRKLEMAGEFIAWKAMRPVFWMVWSLACGLILNPFFGKWLFIVGLIIGSFTAQMFLKRTIRVFRPANFARLGALLAGVFLLWGLCALDVLGIVRYVPSQQRVEQIVIRSSGWYGDDWEHTISNPEGIGKMLEIHRQIVEDIPEDGDMVLNIEYQLTNSLKATRQYRLSQNGAVSDALDEFFRRPECLLGYGGKYASYESFVDDVEMIQSEWLDEPITDKAQIRAVLDAVCADCETGCFSVWNARPYDWSLDIDITTTQGSGDIWFPVPPVCQETIDLFHILAQQESQK